MAKKASRRLVVDASVARSATRSEDPTATACRRFLDDILKICHKVVLTREVKSEWDYAALQVDTKPDAVRARFLLGWMVEMQSKGTSASARRSQCGPPCQDQSNGATAEFETRNHRGPALSGGRSSIRRDRHLSRRQRSPIAAWHLWELPRDQQGCLVQPGNAWCQCLGLAKKRS